MIKRTVPNSRMSLIKMTGGIREVLSRADELERQGKSIIHMEIGRPDFDSPSCAKEAVKKALDNGLVHYTDMAGSSDLRKAIAKKYNKENNLAVDADKNVIVTSGAIEALCATFLTLFNQGDEIIVPSPYFPAYADQIAIANMVLVEAPTAMENGFRLTRDILEKKLSDKTRAILINSPNNPSGAVLSKQDLDEIAAFAIENDLWVISDECYEKFLYDGEHICIASLPGMQERTITISAASKTWSMTGWRVGWLITPSFLHPYVNKCHQNLTTCANSFAQAGVAAAFSGAGEDVSRMIQEYRRRRDMVALHLSEIPGFEFIKPNGAFYAFPRISALDMNGFKFCSWLLEEAGVSSVPGEVFGMPGHIRLAYCRSYDYIEEGMMRIKNAVAQLTK